MSLIAMEGGRGGKDLPDVFARAMAQMDECDGVVILMERKEGGLRWFAPAQMHLQTLVYYCWSALCHFGNMK